MPVTIKRLFVFAHLAGNWAPCGQLELTEDGSEVVASSFAYGTRYLKRVDALEVDPVSLSIHNREAVHGQLLLPAGHMTHFGGIRDAAPDAWGRRVIEAQLKVPANSLPESVYLVHAGSDRIGALDVRESLHAEPRPSLVTWDSLQYLMDAAERIDEGAPVPTNLEAIFQNGSGLGGARPKASVRDGRDVLWMAKFSRQNDAFNFPAVEAATLRLAVEAGLTAPPVRLVKLGARNVLLVRRFDRYWGAPGHEADKEMTNVSVDTAPAHGDIEFRRGFVSALTALACPEMDSPNKSYGELAHAVRQFGHPRVIRQDNRELFARMVFNIFVSNNDDHLRNHGFLWDAHLHGWRLSPLYDVLPTPSVAYERNLHLGVGPKGRAATLDNAYAARELFTLTPADAARLISQVWEKVREWRVYFEGYGVPLADIAYVTSAFRHIDDVSTPELQRELARLA